MLSSRSSRRIEEVAAAVAEAGGRWWFQVYIMQERELTAGLVRRAAAAGAQALVLTGDTPVVGRRALCPARADQRPGLQGQPRAAGRPVPGAFVPASLDDIGWLAEISGGLPVVVKGVLRADDAAACLSAGAAGVIVSNHGGRQLDQALPTALALPAVRAAAAGRPVFVDGGVRSPENVLAGLALGAPLVFVGRPVLWALACDGADGVQAWLEDLTAGVADVMALAGRRVGGRAARPRGRRGPRHHPVRLTRLARPENPHSHADPRGRTLGCETCHHGGRRQSAYLVTEAQPPLSADIASRQRRYLIMMGIRIACFAATIALFVEGAGWWAAIPAVGAITIPYFAVVIANGGREPATPRFPCLRASAARALHPPGRNRVAC